MDDPAHATILTMLARRIAADRGREALWIPVAEGYQSRTWNDLARDIGRLAALLAQMGVRPGDRVAQVSDNRQEWIVADLAIQVARGVHVPMHAALAGSQLARQIADCGATFVFVADASQLQKLTTPDASLSDGLMLLTHESCDLPSPAGINIQNWQSAIAAMDDLAGESAISAAAASTSPDDLATILYSSGTTGEPKGVMLTQRNLASNAHAMCEAFDVNPDDLRLNFLPFSHIFARTCDLYTWIGNGTRLALVANRESIIPSCQLLHPALLNGVPYFYEKVYRQLRESGQSETPGILSGLFGGGLRLACSGGAALPLHVAEYYERQGIPLLQGYGLTESSPVITMSTRKAYRNGTVGRVIPGVEVARADDGEILTRGPHVMVGYWNRPADTAAVIRDGWLHTGDLGEIDAAGYVTITGRKKELLVTSAGKNIAPVALEALLTEDPFILQAMIIGDGRSYLTALIVPNPDVLREHIIKNGIPVSSREQALAYPGVLAIYEQAIAERLSHVSRHEQVRKFTLLDHGFTVENGDLTPTLKLRRPVILAKHAAEIERMYGEFAG